MSTRVFCPHCGEPILFRPRLQIEVVASASHVSSTPVFSVSTRLTQDILSFIQANKGIDERSLWRMFMSYMSLREMKDALEQLVASGHIVMVKTETGENAYNHSTSDL